MAHLPKNEARSLRKANEYALKKVNKNINEHPDIQRANHLAAKSQKSKLVKVLIGYTIGFLLGIIFMIWC